MQTHCTSPWVEPVHNLRAAVRQSPPLPQQAGYAVWPSERAVASLLVGPGGLVCNKHTPTLMPTML